MKIKRKVFINRRNNQASVTIPKKIIEQLIDLGKNQKCSKKIMLDITISKGGKR